MGGYRVIRLGILTSSRADFGIYIPLLRLLAKRHDFHFEIIAFGTHLSPAHGYTLDEIVQSGFDVLHTIESVIAADTPAAIAASYGLTSIKFADFWKNNAINFDFVMCLGDRYEMAAAVMAGVPHGIKYIHLHAGETTLGAIDNVYRHSITLASIIQFVSTASYKERIKNLLDDDSNCYEVGSLSLDGLTSLTYLSKAQFFEQWSIDLSKSTVLVTLHPETVAFPQNEYFAYEAFLAIKTLSMDKQVVITMPNADTYGQIFRSYYMKLKSEYPEHVFLVESFGKQSYFTCMKYADYLLGNSSSGIIEAASFKKFVINIGDRQKGRAVSDNVIHVPFDRNSIVNACKRVAGKEFEGENIYYKPLTAQLIIDTIKNYHASIQ